MAQAFEIIMDKRQIEEVRRMLASVPKAWPRVAKNAINKTATTVRSKIVKRISKDTGIKQKAVREQTRLRRASRAFLQATVSLLGKSIPIINMAARETKKGVTYKAGKGKRTLIPGGFIATMPSGHTGAFMRRHHTRLPIRELFGPNIAGAYEGELDMEIRVEATGLLQHYIDEEIGRLLEKRRAAA